MSCNRTRCRRSEHNWSPLPRCHPQPVQLHITPVNYHYGNAVHCAHMHSKESLRCIVNATRDLQLPYHSITAILNYTALYMTGLESTHHHKTQWQRTTVTISGQTSDDTLLLMTSETDWQDSISVCLFHLLCVHKTIN